MPIFEYNKLKKKQETEINNLIKVCNTYDGLERFPLLLNDNLYEDMYCFYLYYEKKELVSVLLIDQPIFEEAEITGYTLPAYRRQGYFYELLEKAINELACFDIYKILLVVEPGSKSGLLAAKALAEYENSEYMLIHDLSIGTEDHINTHIKFREIKKQVELDSILEILSDKLDEEVVTAANTAINTEDMICVGAFIEDELTGLCNLSLGSNRAYLFGLYVLENHRRRHLGYSFVQYMISTSIESGMKALLLQVKGNNKAALNLYLKASFKVLNQYDYYAIYMEEEIDT